MTVRSPFPINLLLDCLLHSPLDTPEVTHPPNDVEKTLSTLGVKYTHRNDDLIAESTIEGQRMRKLIEVGYDSPISRANPDHWK